MFDVCHNARGSVVLRCLGSHHCHGWRWQVQDLTSSKQEPIKKKIHKILENIDGIISHWAVGVQTTQGMLLRKHTFISLKILNWQTNRKIKRSFTDYFLSFPSFFWGRTITHLNLSHTHAHLKSFSCGCLAAGWVGSLSPSYSQQPQALVHRGNCSSNWKSDQAVKVNIKHLNAEFLSPPCSASGLQPPIPGL